MEPLTSMPIAERVGAGLFVIEADRLSTFFIGDTNAAMVPFYNDVAKHWFVRGPFYFFAAPGVVKLYPFSDKIKIESHA